MSDTKITQLLKDCAKDEQSLKKLENAFEELNKKAQNLKLLEAAIRNDYDSILITEMDLDKPGPKIVYVNEGFTKMTGYSREEAVGQTPRILHGPKTDRAVLDKLKYSLLNGRAFFGQTINYRKDGSEFVNQWDIHPLLDSDGNITHWVSYQHDITERKRAELSVINSNAETDELYEDSKRTIVDLAENGAVVSANKAFREMIGYHKDEIKNTFIWDLMPLKFGNSLKAQFERIWKEEFSQGKTYRMMLRHKNGLPVQVEIQTKKMDLNTGEFVRCDVRNLTLRKRILNTLKKRSTDYTRMFERKVDFNYGLILDDDNKFRFKWLSDGFKKITGYDVEECLHAEGWRDLIHPDDRGIVAEHVMKAFDGMSSTITYRIVTKDGTTKKIMDYAKADSYDNMGNAQAIVASAIDVSSREETVA
ncbi:MAG: PAS domain S-box protein [Bacteroidetes bacterium]|nr:PAS domain S-box protein [Bacteroidota bacterium]